MTRPTPGFASTVRLRSLFIFLVALGVGAFVLADPFAIPEDPAIHVSGDGSAEVLALLQGGDFGAPLWFADQAANARLVAIFLRRPENAGHVPGLEKICSDVCNEQIVTVFHVLRPFKASKIVVINIAAMPNSFAARLDDGQKLDEIDVICLARIVADEVPRIAAIQSEVIYFGRLHPCGFEPGKKARRILPYGL